MCVIICQYYFVYPCVLWLFRCLSNSFLKPSMPETTACGREFHILVSKVYIESHPPTMYRTFFSVMCCISVFSRLQGAHGNTPTTEVESGIAILVGYLGIGASSTVWKMKKGKCRHFFMLVFIVLCHL